MEVTGAIMLDIDTSDENKGRLQLHELMGIAQRARSVASTDMNEQSSRSHSVFTLVLNGYNEVRRNRLRCSLSPRKPSNHSYIF
jgi:hypothetical protein